MKFLILMIFFCLGNLNSLSADKSPAPSPLGVIVHKTLDYFIDVEAPAN
jgi:hypothetical protein